MLNKVILSVSLCLLTGSSIAQTCNSSIAETTPTARFTPQENGTVLDTQTNLIWKRCSEGQAWNGTSCTGGASSFTWQGALDAVQTSNGSDGYAGQTDWRVPNIKELGSIVELRCYSPAINLSIFPNTSSTAVWSSSPNAYGRHSAWFVYFSNGTDGASRKYYYPQVRLVRSGQ